MTGMCTDVVRDIVLQQADSFKTAKSFVEKLQMIVMNRMGPAKDKIALDVGHVQDQWHEEKWEEPYVDDGEEIKYIGTNTLLP